MSKQSVNKLVDKVLEITIEESYYNFLRCLVSYSRPDVIVELGTDRGRSTLSMLSAIKKDGHIYTIDIRDKFPIKHKQVTKIISDDTRFDVNTLPDIDLLFIDSCHTYDHVSKQLTLYLPKVKIGGIVVMDDITHNGGMIKIWNEIKYPKQTLNHLHLHSGFGLFIKDK